MIVARTRLNFFSNNVKHLFCVTHTHVDRNLKVGH